MKYERYLFVAYDIQDNSIRKVLSRLLMFYGLSRLQYSVFSGPVSLSEKEMLVKQIKEMEFDDGDKVQIIDMCKRCVESRIVIGDEPERPEHLIF